MRMGRAVYVLEHPVPQRRKSPSRIEHGTDRRAARCIKVASSGGRDREKSVEDISILNLEKIDRIPCTYKALKLLQD